jgi:hypothetical protein
MTTNPHSNTLTAFTESLRQRMKKQLDQISAESNDEIQVCRKSIPLLHTLLLELNAIVASYEFKDENEEILFFRKIKPQFLTAYLYAQKCFELKVSEPFSELDKPAYYQKHLRDLESFRKEHQAFYTYCLSEDKQWDDHYFTRQACFPNPDLDKRVTTGYDKLLATLLANDELKGFITTQLQTPHLSAHASSLTWTAPKAALIELTYALKAAEVFNHGKADLKQIAVELEKLFQIRLGNYYRVYQDIRLRKSGQTNFLDTLKSQFLRMANEKD